MNVAVLVAPSVRSDDTLTGPLRVRVPATLALLSAAEPVLTSAPSICAPVLAVRRPATMAALLKLASPVVVSAPPTLTSDWKPAAPWKTELPPTASACDTESSLDTWTLLLKVATPETTMLERAFMLPRTVAVDAARSAPCVVWLPATVLLEDT